MPRSSISRKKSGAKSKRVKAGATTATFPGAITTRTPLPTEKPAVRTSQQEKKSLSNKLQYQRQKCAHAVKETEELQVDVSDGLKREAILSKDVKKLTDQTKHANESAAKAMSTLSGSRRKLGSLSEKRKAEKSENRIQALDAAKRHRTKMEEKDACHGKALVKMQKIHSNTLKQETSTSFKLLRNQSKRTVQLGEQLKATEMEAHQSQSYLQDQHESEINCLEQQLSEKNDLTNNLLGIKLKREHLLKQKKQVRIQSQLKKSIQVLERKVDTVVEEKDAAKEQIVRSEASVDVRVKEAVTAAKFEERNYFSGVLAKEKSKVASLKLQVDSSKSFQTSLMDAKVS